MAQRLPLAPGAGSCGIVSCSAGCACWAWGELSGGLVSCGKGVIFCIWLMAVSPTFRWAVFVFLVLAGAGIYKLIQQSNEDDASYRQREATARTLIQPSQLVLNCVKVGQSYGLWQVNGTVQNNSQYPLSRFWLHVTVQDCPAAPSCVTMGEDDVGIDVKVPPGPIALV
jgi:hypothetical protein